ncbi:MAG: VCBS repeat-containing protein, partial [Bacteroidota bacterium]|nr:VCBS repeat-containing protein [Bacteroidota bacterium]
SGDIDNDGDLDLFVGERIKIGSYGLPGSGFILINDGSGNFSNQTKEIAPSLTNIGMITDAAFEDIDSNGNLDLIVVGEYMGINIFKNEGSQFIRIENKLLDEKGWWNKIHIADLNNDGKNDLIVGNHGLNSRFSASKTKPLRLYYNDFDKNGFGEGIICFEAENGKDYPYALRHDLIAQIKSLKKKFPDYESFKTADITNIFDQKLLNQSDIHTVNTLETSIYIKKNGFEFQKINIPKETQFSPVYSINSHDFDNDGDKDILLGGNLYDVKPEIGIYDASYGLYLENLGNLKFKYHRDGKGFFVKGEIRDILISGKNVFVSINNEEMEVFKF